MPSSNPSLSMAPTVSAQPSASPSATPTSIPSVSPTANPTSVPTNSIMPSNTPTIVPSHVPSSSPTWMPSNNPSQQPSNLPSISNAPSNSPTALPTSSPTYNTITGLKEVDGGIQQGCSVPSFMSAANFAEKSMQRMSVEFMYTIAFDENNIGTNEDQLIGSYIHGLEMDLQAFVFNEYVDCDSIVWEKHRILKKMDRPVGVSNVPVDELASGFICSGSSKRGERCVPVNGKFTLLYTDLTSIDQYGEEVKVLTAIFNAFADGNFVPTNPDVSVVAFGKNGDSFPSQTAIVIPKITVDNKEEDADKLTMTSGIAVGVSILVVGIALLVGVRRRKYAQYQKSDGESLTSLRERHPMGTSDEQYDLFEIQSSDGNIFEVVLSSQAAQHSAEVERSIIPSNILFPDSDSSLCNTCDVHRCNSVMCQECGPGSGNRVQFIDSSEWYMGENSDLRSYSTSNTVNL
jgi:hypothetical protein